MHELDLDALTGKRLGPYLAFNPVSNVQIWQWCSAMGDRNPLYSDSDYRAEQGFKAPVAPPAMMQMWTMRDVAMQYAPGSTDSPPYQIFDSLTQAGYPSNVAVSYDITFHKLLAEGDRAQHYTTVVSISDVKQTALGAGHFVTEHVEYLDQNSTLFAEALITYFQYRASKSERGNGGDNPAPLESSREPSACTADDWQPDFIDLHAQDLQVGQTLPALSIPITHKLIVSGAIATQDFIDVHHNAPVAQAAGMPDIFMNILTTCGLCARYLSDWAGPASRLQRLQFKLMAPNVPGDTMVLRGHVDKLAAEDEQPLVTVCFNGKNSRGNHVTGNAELTLAR